MPAERAPTVMRQVPFWPRSASVSSTAAEDIRHYLGDKYRVAVLCADRRKADILRDYLADRQIPAAVDRLPP